MTKYEIRYHVALRISDRESEWKSLPDTQWVRLGPFKNHDLAEQALTNLTNNPQFRGGEIVELDR